MTQKTSSFHHPLNKMRSCTSECDFRLHEFRKVTWSALKTGAREAYQLISNIYFTQQQYEDLLHSSVDTCHRFGVDITDVEAAACKWVKNHRHIWQPWMPRKRKKIYLGGMFSKTGRYMRDPGIIPSE